MPFIHGKNSAIAIWDSSGASQLVQGDLNSISFSWTRDNPETTTMGKETKQRIAGIRDAKISFAGIWNASAVLGIDTVISALMTASTNTLIKYYPAGVTTGCGFYTGCFLVSEYSLQSTLSGAVSVTGAFDMAAGSMTASTV